jgi:hypothetical protein
MKDKESILDVKEEKLGVQGTYVFALTVIQLILALRSLDHKIVFMETSKGCVHSKIGCEFEYMV